VSCELNALPSGEVRKDLPPGFGDFLFDLGDFLIEADAERMGFPVFFEFFQLVLQFGDGLFEVKLVFHCYGSLGLPAQAGNVENWGRFWEGGNRLLTPGLAFDHLARSVFRAAVSVSVRQFVSVIFCGIQKSCQSRISPLA